MKLTEAQLDDIRHALGINQSGREYRNHYCTYDGDPKMEAMVEAGAMRRGVTINEGRDRMYHVTDAGRAALAQEETK